MIIVYPFVDFVYSTHFFLQVGPNIYYGGGVLFFSVPLIFDIFDRQLRFYLVFFYEINK